MKNVKKTILNTLLLGLIAVTLTSCASSMDYDAPLLLYSSINPNEALIALTSNEETYLKNDGPIIYGLNAGMVAHTTKNSIESNSYFDLAEKYIAASYTKSISKNVASYIISENTLDYCILVEV
jgi:hypothetical protein